MPSHKGRMCNINLVTGWLTFIILPRAALQPPKALEIIFSIQISNAFFYSRQIFFILCTMSKTTGVLIYTITQDFEAV
jgi:hypothetical protein